MDRRPVLVALRFQIDMSTIPQGSVERKKWSRQLIRELSVALFVPVTRFELVLLSPGSVIARIRVMPHSGDTSFSDDNAAELVSELETLVKNPNSTLYRGPVFQHVDPTFFQVLLEPPVDDNASHAWSSSRPVWWSTMIVPVVLMIVWWHD